MLLPVELEGNKKFFEWFNNHTGSEFNTTDGLLNGNNNIIEQKLDSLWNNIDLGINRIGNNIDSAIDKIGDKIATKVTEALALMFADLVNVVAIGAIGFSMYQAIKMMFTQNKSVVDSAKPSSKILLGYFIYFILRVLNAVIQVRGGTIGR